jgi:predicted enzyme related to lactoylglutathione lyase
MRTTVVLDCRDPDALLEFWETALGYRLADKIDDYRVLVPAPGEEPGPVFILNKLAEAKADGSHMHVDVHPDDPDAHLTRLHRLGATLVGERVERYGIWWQTIADPEGHLLCVVAGAQGPDEGDASSG